MRTIQNIQAEAFMAAMQSGRRSLLKASSVGDMLTQAIIADEQENEGDDAALLALMKCYCALLDSEEQAYEAVDGDTADKLMREAFIEGAIAAMRLPEPDREAVRADLTESVDSGNSAYMFPTCLGYVSAEIYPVQVIERVGFQLGYQWVLDSEAIRQYCEA